MTTSDIKNDTSVLSASDQQRHDAAEALDRRIANDLTLLHSKNAGLDSDKEVVNDNVIHTRKTEIARKLVRVALERDGLRPDCERTDEDGKSVLGAQFIEVQRVCQSYLTYRPKPQQ